MMTSVVRVEGLSMALPDGTVLVEDTHVLVQPGEVVSLLGPSGAGKTTLLRAIFAPVELRQKGYDVTWSIREVMTEPAYVPQRGALLDHLDVAGNIALAQAGAGVLADVATWLRAVDLDESLARPGRSVAALSGGQAQRVAVARTFAALECPDLAALQTSMPAEQERESMLGVDAPLAEHRVELGHRHDERDRRADLRQRRQVRRPVTEPRLQANRTTIERSTMSV